MNLQKLHIPVSHGRLEALLERPDTPPAAAVVVCHPHPLYGGTMHNNVTYRMAKAMVRHNMVALRFNFRGVGTSTGQHGGGETETGDVIAALDFLEKQLPGLPLWATGMSFGARVALAAGAPEARVARLLGAGLVPRMFSFSFLEHSAKPKAFIHGENDELAAVDSVRDLVDRLPPPRSFHIVPGASHLFVGQLDALDKALDAAIAFLQTH